jgi:hypothetical protein
MVSSTALWREGDVLGDRFVVIALLAVLIPLFCGACGGMILDQDHDAGASNTGDAGGADPIVLEDGAEQEPSPGAYCPIIGNADYQFSFGTAACNACIRQNCCVEATACFSVGDAGSVYAGDGRMSACADRTTCQRKCLDGTGVVVGDTVSCEVRCTNQSSVTVSQASRGILDCAFTRCATNPGGGALCKP